MEALEGPATTQPGPPAIQPGQALDFAHLSPETAVMIRTANRQYSMSARDVIKWMAPTAPLSEAVRLLVTAQNVGLDPLLNEIELLEIKGRWSVYVRKSGLIKVALRYPEYDGHETGLIIQDIDETRPAFDVIGCYCPRGCKIVGGWAKVYRKGVSRPIIKRVNVEDYAKSKGIWQDNPAVMIEKVALAQALRESFPIGEIYDEAELPGVQRAVEVSMSGPVPAKLSPPDWAASAREASKRMIEVKATDALLEATSADPAAYRATRSAIEAAAHNDALEPEHTPPSEGDGPTVPVIPGFEVVDVELDPSAQPCTAEQQVEFSIAAAKLGMTSDTFVSILAKRGVESVDQLTVFQMTEILVKLSEKLSSKEFDFLAAPAQETK